MVKVAICKNCGGWAICASVDSEMAKDDAQWHAPDLAVSVVSTEFWHAMKIEVCRCPEKP